MLYFSIHYDLELNYDFPGLKRITLLTKILFMCTEILSLKDDHIGQTAQSSGAIEYTNHISV